MKKLILGIETSCDETALAVLKASGGLRAPRFNISKALVSSQIPIHRPFGGVVPMLAKREHLKNLPILFRKLGGEKIMRNVDMIAATVGPGLEPALWTGINFAKELGKKFKKPLVGVNHLEGHLYSFLLPKKSTPHSLLTTHYTKMFPAIALIVSGGHTILLRMKNLTTWKKLGETRDDAVGEAFDKVARILELPYPGGPEIEKLASRGNPTAINFPRPMAHDTSPAGEYDFSFSGLKTAVLYYLRDNPRTRRADIAACFEQAAVDVLLLKTVRAAKSASAHSIMLSGGVAANQHLRDALKKEKGKIGLRFLVADMRYNTDNAVMIAAAGYIDLLARRSQGAGGRKKKYPLTANGALNI